MQTTKSKKRENKVFAFIPGFQTRGFPAHFYKFQQKTRVQINFTFFCAFLCGRPVPQKTAPLIPMKFHPPGIYPGLRIQAYPDLSTLGSDTMRLRGMGRRDRVLMLSPAFCVTCFLLSLELIHILIGSFFDRQDVIICRKRR